MQWRSQYVVTDTMYTFVVYPVAVAVALASLKFLHPEIDRAVNGPRILKDCGPGLLAKEDLNRSLGPVLQRANIIA